MIALDPAGDASIGWEINGEEARPIWAYVLGKVGRQCGPFRGVEKTDHLDRLVDTAVRLFPCGAPGRNRKWQVPDSARISEYAPLSSEVAISMSLTVYCASPNLGD